MRKKSISFALSLALVAGLAPNVAKAAENVDDLQKFMDSRSAEAEPKAGPSGDVTYTVLEGEPVQLEEGVTLDEAVAVEVAARDYSQYDCDYVYNNLNADEKAFIDAFKAMCDEYITTNVGAATELQGKMLMHPVPYGNLSQSRVNDLVTVFSYQYPQYYFIANYWAYGGGNLYMGIYNEFANGTDRAAATEKFFAEVDKGVAAVNEETLDCYKALAAHDYVCNLTTYDTDFSLSASGYNQTAWSTFMMDETVCAGYSKAYTIIANAVGLDTCGDTSPQGEYAHAWNRVKVDDGWYYVDCTWDDDPEGEGTVDYSFFLIGKYTLFAQDGTPDGAAHTTEPCWDGLLPDCPKDFVPGVTSNGIYVQSVDNNCIVAGAVANFSFGKEHLEYQWQVAEMGTENWTLISDWNSSEWLTWAPKRSGDYVLVCNVRVAEDPEGEQFKPVQVAAGVNFRLNEAHIVGKCQMPWYGEGGGFLIGFETDENPNQSYQYEVQILDCTKYANGEDAWIWSSGKHTVSEGNAYWTVWQPEYGYYWTLFIVYDGNGTEIGRACYGFENIGQ